MDCLCGSKQYKEFKRPDSVVVDEAGTSQVAEILLAECLDCGLVRQISLPFSTEEQYTTYYKTQYPPVKQSYTKKTYAHDLKVAKLRCNAYKIATGQILDVGSGSGAFVDECRKRGIEAFGCEISNYAYAKNDEFIYHDRLENINFPTDYFDVVTCHDVLEHVLDPIKFIAEMFRITNQQGQCIIDIPNFFSEDGQHHWKDVEHIWFFNTDQFKKMLQDVGFLVHKTRHPLESKTVFYLEKPEQVRPTILMPPGMGDAYWSVIKLQAFLKHNNLGIPDVLIAANREGPWEGHKRSFPFLEMFPFLKASWKNVKTNKDPKKKQIWKEAYSQKKRTIFTEKATLGCDYFIAYNGRLGAGDRMEDCDSHLETNWHPPMFVSLEQERFRKECIKKYGKYIVFYFPFFGTFQHWTKEFSIDAVAEYIRLVIKNTGFTPIFTGAAWDADKATNKGLKDVMARIPEKFIDLTGKTTIEQLFGLIRGSRMVVGYPSGLTIMSAVLRQKTLTIWNNYYNNDFAWNSCPPDVKNKTYFIEFTKNLTPKFLAERTIKIMNDKEFHLNDLSSVIPTKKASAQDWKAALDKLTLKNVVPSARDMLEVDACVTVMCVLKKDSGFTVDYVKRLRNMVSRNTTVPYKFVCLTDIDISPDICESIKLTHNYDKSFSKIELFRNDLVHSKRIINFGLNSIIVSNIDALLLDKHDFVALRPWNRKNLQDGLCSTSIMGWKNGGTYSFIYDQFKIDESEKYYRGDQEYISKALAGKKKNINFYQDSVNGIYSYKRDCKSNLPQDAIVVCFHGRPRQKDVNIGWVKENWI